MSLLSVRFHWSTRDKAAFGAVRLRILSLSFGSTRTCRVASLILRKRVSRRVFEAASLSTPSRGAILVCIAR